MAYNKIAPLEITTVAVVTKSIVLSDVDGTLIRGSLVLDHAVWLHAQKVIDLGDIPAKWLANQKNELLIMELAEAYRDAINGMALKELRVAEYMVEVMSTEKKFYSVLERLKLAHAAGEKVILISGSPQYLVGHFARIFGFTAIGSTYHRDKTRKLNGQVTGMFTADAKKRAIAKLNLESYARVTAYGDTSSDMPLLAAAHYSVLVDPSPETLALYGRVDEILHS